MAPILPGLSDKPELMADVVRAARDAGATSIWTNVLYLRPGTREHFLEHLARDWPEQLPRYERLYRGRAYLSKGEIEPVRREVAELRDRFGIREPRHDSPPRVAPSTPRRLAPVRVARSSATRIIPRRRSGGTPPASRQLELPLSA